MAGSKSTEAIFVPERHRGLAKLNAVELLVVLSGIALCSTGMVGTIVGIPVALGGLYSGFFIPSNVKRGLYFGKCPHCSAAMSATHYQERLDCPTCGEAVGVRNGRFEAIQKGAS